MNWPIKISYIFILLVFISSCTSDTDIQEAPFAVVTSEHSNIDFSNDLPVDVELNIFNYMYYYNGGGTGVGDLNNDGLMDIVFSSNIDQERIYINQGGLKFQDISDIAKVDGGPNSWTNGVSIVDINGDGFLDIYLSQVGTYRNLDCHNKLFVCTGLNDNGNPIYEEQSQQYGLDFKGFSTQAGFFDFDLDGDLDMFLMNHSLHHNGTFGQRADFLDTYDKVSGDRFFRNDGGTFKDITAESKIHSSVIGYGLGFAFSDVNNDGYPDIYVGNDFHENDYLYINQGDGTFKDELTNQIKHTSRFSMGVDIADINNDGYQDIVTLDMLPEDPVILKSSEGEDALDIFNFKLGYGYNHQFAKNALQLNQGNNTFKEIASFSGIHATDWSWTPLFFDFDMDGVKDLFISNGIPKRMNDIDYIDFVSGNEIQYKIQFDQLEDTDMGALDKIPEIKLLNKFYRGNQSLQFSDLSQQIRGHETSYSNSAAYADFDLDGDYDLVCNNINQQAFLYENIGVGHAAIPVKLIGPKANPFGIGAKLIADYGTEKRYIEYYPAKGFQSSMMNTILLPRQDLKQVEIIWPGGLTETIASIEERLSFDYKRAKKSTERKGSKQAVFVDHTSKLGVDFVHQENRFVEFNREPLIPFATSSEGPALAVGDVNNDGRQDFFVGSSKRERSVLFMQNAMGKFDKTYFNAIDSTYEEVNAVFEDIDGDGDLDLLIATGGNEYRLNSPYTEQLLLRNEGGNFVKDDQALADFNTTASCLRLSDIDEDGDLDIFIGGRATPRAYGEIPVSYLLENDGKGNFKDISEVWFKDGHKLGFVKDAQWDDVDQNGFQDLVIALEWGTVKVFYNDGKGFESKNLSDAKGWWNSITIEDFDGDGDLDIFAGNLGLNARLKASKAQPVRMYYEDFDDNGTKEQLLTYYVGGKEIPFSNMKELQKQIPSLKKKFLKAKDFAQTSIQTLIGKDKMKSSQKFSADRLENTLWLNNGSQGFEAAELSYEMQLTPYYTGLAIDVNKDGITDLIPGGNYHYCNIQMGRYDVENGSWLTSKGSGRFEFNNMIESPLKGQVKQIKQIEIGADEYLIFTQNNDAVKLLKIESN